MQASFSLKTLAALLVVSSAAFCQTAPAQEAPGKDAQIKGLPPRPTPGDYQAHAKVGDFTVAAEFTEHAISTPEATLSSEDFVAVEVGFFGPPDSHLKISHEDFSLRINTGKKAPVTASVQYGIVFRSLKDPEWQPPEPPASKSKTGINTGGDSGQDSAPPPPVHIPIEVERAMQQRVQKAALPQGDRSLPAAGLIFFPFRGKAKNIRSIELIYDGPAGKVNLRLH
ncbi:MAG: hypothetical protein P4L56_17200 [Candidatus Sulfopaludibacter sp.]|nr:hypothetical protein [Candidatus Sulfopaludibacter sp.]